MLNFSLLREVQWVSVFDEEPHSNRILVWPFPVLDHCPGQITVLVGQDRRWAAATWISNGKQNVWRYSVCGGPAGRRWRLKLGMRVSHPCWYSGTTTLSNSVILVWAESGQLPAKSWGLAVRGRKGFRKPTLTLHQVVTIKGEILTCTVLVWAQWLPYEFS